MNKSELENVEEILEELRRIILQTAVEKYEDASIAGLCAEGAWEAAVDAVKNLDLKKILVQVNQK